MRRRAAIDHHNCYRKKKCDQQERNTRDVANSPWLDIPIFIQPKVDFSFLFFLFCGFACSLALFFIFFFCARKFASPRQKGNPINNSINPHRWLPTQSQLSHSDGKLERFAHLIRHHYYNIIWNLNSNKRLPFHRLNRPEKHTNWTNSMALRAVCCVQEKTRTFFFRFFFWLSNEREKSESEETRRSWISILFFRNFFFCVSLFRLRLTERLWLLWGAKVLYNVEIGYVTVVRNRESLCPGRD